MFFSLLFPFGFPGARRLLLPLTRDGLTSPLTHIFGSKSQIGRMHDRKRGINFFPPFFTRIVSSFSTDMASFSFCLLQRPATFRPMKNSIIRIFAVLQLLQIVAFAASNSVVNLSHYDLMRVDFERMKAEGI